ncbi:MAG: hypothetical protein ABIQ31_20935 [Ferruginibacter sp.]
MKNYTLACFSLTILFTLLACNNENKNSYAIRDFRSLLQPYLTKLVSEAIVPSSDSSIKNLASDKELVQLSHCEHPVLRAVALKEILERNSFNHFDILMAHLDDTAIIATNETEWGIQYGTIADYLIDHSQWKNQEEKNKTINAVITQHNYLRSAYSILYKIEPREEYYLYIKNMTTRHKLFNEIEDALNGLAKFKKSEDVKIIQAILLARESEMTEKSFTLMELYPNQLYLDVYEEYYKYSFYRSICRDHNSNRAVDFITSLATYKNEKSAAILNKILNRQPMKKCAADDNRLKEELILAIWNNPCVAYTKMRNQIEPAVNSYKKHTIVLPDEKKYAPELTNELITW